MADPKNFKGPEGYTFALYGGVRPGVIVNAPGASLDHGTWIPLTELRAFLTQRETLIAFDAIETARQARAPRGPLKPGDPAPPCACGTVEAWHNPGCSLYPEGGYPADQPWRGPPKPAKAWLCPRCSKNEVGLYGDHCATCKAETRTAFTKDLESTRVRR